jgi:hypothetical protein
MRQSEKVYTSEKWNVWRQEPLVEFMACLLAFVLCLKAKTHPPTVVAQEVVTERKSGQLSLRCYRCQMNSERGSVRLLVRKQRLPKTFPLDSSSSCLTLLFFHVYISVFQAAIFIELRNYCH